jgi:hypothetical protein
MQMGVRVLALTLVAIFTVTGIVRAVNRTPPSPIGTLDDWLLLPSLVPLVAVLLARRAAERPTDYFPQVTFLALALGFVGITDLRHPLLWVNVLTLALAGFVALRDVRGPRTPRPDVVPFKVPR